MFKEIKEFRESKEIFPTLPKFPKFSTLPTLPKFPTLSLPIIPIIPIIPKSLFNLGFACHIVPDHRTFIEDYLKIVEFIEWLQDFYPEKAAFLTK